MILLLSYFIPMASVRIILWKHDKKKNGTFPLAIRLTKDRKSSYLFTGQYIEEKYWDNKQDKVKKSHPNSIRLNNLLLIKLAEANEKLVEYETDKNKQSVSMIKKQIVNKANADFFYAAQIHLNRIKDRKKYNQYGADKGRLNIFKAFLKADELPFSELDVALLKKFQAYILHERKCSHRTVANYLILIRLIYNLAIEEGLIDKKNYPFGKGKIKIKIPESEKIGLNKQEIRKLEQPIGLSDAQQKAVHVWLFSFYLAGARIGDVLQLRWGDFRDDRLYYRMNKNEKLVSLKVPDKALGLLKQYHKKGSSKDDLVFPYLEKDDFKDPQILNRRTKTATRSLNRRLKIVAQKLQIEKNLSMHIARHSFGNLSGDKIPIQMLQKLYRHSSITTTVNYQSNFLHKETDDALEKVITF